VCGLANTCAIEAGSALPCWCSDVEISAQALARIPAALVNEACLCPRCAELGRTAATRATENP